MSSPANSPSMLAANPPPLQRPRRRLEFGPRLMLWVAGVHLAILLIAIVGAWLWPRPKEYTTVMDSVSLVEIAGAPGSGAPAGGNPAPEPPPPVPETPPVVQPPLPVELPPPPKKSEPTPPVETPKPPPKMEPVEVPKPKKETPKVEPKKVEVPKVVPKKEEPKVEPKKEEPTWKANSAEAIAEKMRQQNANNKPSPRPSPSPSKVDLPPMPNMPATQRATGPSQIGSSPSRSGTNPNVTGAGATGNGAGVLAAANYEDVVRATMYRLWQQPTSSQVGNRNGLRAPVTIRVLRNGQVVAKRRTGSSGVAAMDQSVDQLLARLNRLDPFPSNLPGASMDFDVVLQLAL